MAGMDDQITLTDDTSAGIAQFIPFSPKLPDGTFGKSDILAIEVEEEDEDNAVAGYGIIMIDFAQVEKLRDFLNEWIVDHWPEETDED